MPSRLLITLIFLVAACNEPENSTNLEQTLNYLNLWTDSTSVYLPETSEWTNRVEVADINGDSRVDLIFANGGNYSEAGTPEPCRIFINQGAGQPFAEITSQIFGDRLFHSRVAKVQDVNADGYPDILVGTTFQAQSRLYLGSDSALFTDATSTHLPQINLSVGDFEFGDVDNDGDLDLVLADWGPGSNMTNEGGRTQLWLNNGKGKYINATATQMPDIRVRFSWDLEFFDYDNDFDLDIAISCKRCAGSMIFSNDGNGFFSNEPRAIPAYTNNYEFEPMDIDRDGYLDLVTVNDGDIVNGNNFSRREHVFKNNEGRYFTDVTSLQWPNSENIGEDDNNIVFLDYDSDRDPDFLLSSLTGEDRLLENDGKGKFTLHQPVILGEPTPHTLSLVAADINGDHKMDIVMGQGEGETDLEERIFIGSGIKKDSSKPRITHTSISDTLGSIKVYARIHDNKSPSMIQDWRSVVFIPHNESDTIPMNWYGEYLWKAEVPDSVQVNVPMICATDAAGNRRCIVAN